MTQPIESTNLHRLYRAVCAWPTSDSLTLPADTEGSQLLNRHLGQVARMAIAIAKRMFQALEENDDGIPWNTERRKKDASELLFVALAQARLLCLSEAELQERLEQIAASGGPN